MENKLEKIKKEYEKLKVKYNLPSFSDLNKDFEIERLQEKETDFLLRESRRLMLEKNTAYLRFAEMLLNPSNAPMFFFALIKNMNEKEKKMLNELYLELGKHEIESLSLDNIYNEEKEAEFINKFYKNWQDIKEKFSEFLEILKENCEKKQEKSQKGYLG